MSLRWRWAITLAAVAALVGAALVATALFLTRQRLLDQVDTQLRKLVEAVEETSFEPGDLRGPQPLEGVLRALDGAVQVVDSDGDLLLSTPEEPLPVTGIDLALARNPIDPVIRTVEVDGVAHRMIVAHLDLPFDEPPEVALQIARDISGVDAALVGLGQQLALLGLGGVVIAAAAGFLLGDRAGAPLRRLQRGMEEVGRSEQVDPDRIDIRLDPRAPQEVWNLSLAFQEMLTILHGSREQQRRLVADASHELRTPLTALRSNLQTLRQRGELLTPAQQKQLLDAALAEADELRLLSTELVELILTPGREVGDLESIDLAELAETVAARFRRRVDRAIVVVRVENDGKVRGNRSQLERAIANLVDNAVKWGPEGLPIEVVVRHGTVSVHDHGRGIPEEALPHVFERFYRLPGDSPVPGSGLGLAIVAAVVAAHGGETFARNHPDGGAEVGFSLRS